MGGLVEAILLVLAHERTLDMNISCGEWCIYKLEDGRISVSRFDERGKHVEEFLFADPVIAAGRFCDLALRPN